jgi:hypothetical protein
VPQPLAPPAADPQDDAVALLHALAELNRYVNRSAGRLPAVAVVKARWVTDTLRDILETAEIRPVETTAMLTVRGTVRDYLPTTLRSYLALDDEASGAEASGRTPADLLVEQLDTLLESAAGTLGAVRRQDADALATQGHFLRAKFSGSDLDL